MMHVYMYMYITSTKAASSGDSASYVMVGIYSSSLLWSHASRLEKSAPKVNVHDSDARNGSKASVHIQYYERKEENQYIKGRGEKV